MQIKQSFIDDIESPRVFWRLFGLCQAAKACASVCA